MGMGGPSRVVAVHQPRMNYEAFRFCYGSQRQRLERRSNCEGFDIGAVLIWAMSTGQARQPRMTDEAI